ncbi:NADP-dependent oxidoreductase domain-containing protein OS=Castellaniella defragrans OX=75697 GN=HNR28_001893 PE=4 SV=1 [Castellaniella defragrans]
MRTREFGTTGRQVAVLGQGSWYIDEADRQQAVTALQGGIDAGMTHLDTAEMYGSGAAESVVGEAIRGRRDEVFLVSKVLPSNASRAGVVKSCERSLRALGTDHLDVYLLHWRGPVPLEETFEAFGALQRSGKIRAFGVSNFDVEDLEEAWAILGPGKLACNQVLYHLRERAIEHAVIPWCQAHQVAVVAYSPFGHGDFPDARSASGRTLKAIAEHHGATPRQVALAFLTRDPGLFAIPKASSVTHARENASAAALDLTPAELGQLDAAFPRGPRPGYLPMI